MSEIGRELERMRQEQRLAEAMMLGNLIAEIITYKPPRREHWWQLWRPK